MLTLYISRTWCACILNETPLLCPLLLQFSVLFFLLPLLRFHFVSHWYYIVFRNSTISHKTHTFNNYYVTAQLCSMLQVLFLNFLLTELTKSYSQDHGVQTQRTEQTNRLIWNCKLEASCDNTNVPSSGNMNRKKPECKILRSKAVLLLI